MALTPLTATAQKAVDALVAEGRLQRVTADERRCRSFLQQAGDALADLPNITRLQNKYNLAYDAAHDVGEAMLAAYGVRTKHGPKGPPRRVG